MGNKLLIVESPAKAKTIQKFLGKGFQVASSYGHIADLPEDEMGIDIEHGFKPHYLITPDKKKVVKKLSELASSADEVYLASDEDREGEAIAWHLKNFLKLDDKYKRIVFHEITKKAIQNALESPREINEHLVNAQQARRVLDRLVGYRLSPVLWKKIKKGLSAGRVQSVAVRLIVDREKEIKAFVPKRTFATTADFVTSSGEPLPAKYEKEFTDERQVEEFLKNILGSTFTVGQVEKKPGKRTPPPPFTTSTLQQEASRKFGFPVNKTMKIAQYLYENGYITYMRTDSVHLSDEAIAKAKEVITQRWGKNYSHPKQYKTKSKAAQEAHEAIRPTDLALENPNETGTRLDRDALRLYQLIWKRTLASQMTPAKIEHTHININSDKTGDVFKAKGETLVFDGFMRLYQSAEEQENASQLPKVRQGETLELVQIVSKEKFSKPPVRYTEASLVKKLEELEIGRPSTYAPVISTIQRRGYVVRKNIPASTREVKVFRLKNDKISSRPAKEKYGAEKNKLVPTDMGFVVTEFLTEHFADIMDYHFTAQVEEKFDKIALGKYKWQKILEEFYAKFEPIVEQVEKHSRKAKGERLLGTDPQSGKKVYAKIGPFGPMLQLGDSDGPEKPKYASLLPGMSIMDISLDEALKLLQFPVKLGTYENESIFVGMGKYGPYVRYKNKFYSIPPHLNALEITLDDAISIIEQKNKREEPVAEYEGEPVYVLSGKYGPYLKWGNHNINIPRKYNPDTLSEEDIVNLIVEKLEKDRLNTLAEWPDEGYAIRKGGWGKIYVYAPGNKRKLLPRGMDPKKATLEEIKKIFRR